VESNWKQKKISAASWRSGKTLRLPRQQVIAQNAASRTANRLPKAHAAAQSTLKLAPPVASAARHPRHSACWHIFAAHTYQK
jgi:hypothetical protein